MFNKIGFHTGPGGNPTGIGDWMRALDKAKIPFCLKSVDHYGPIFEAQEIMKVSNVPHVLIFRLSNKGGGGYQFDTPPYNDPKYAEDPEFGAVVHWEATIKALPPEFDKSRVWLEVMNEVDKNKSAWLGRFAVRIMQRAEAEGYKVSLFGFAGGEPEPYHWEVPEMLTCLRMVAEKPQSRAVALHEYSFHEQLLKVRKDATGKFVAAETFEAGRLIGRFRELFGACDTHGILRPTVHMTEWGWSLNVLPVPEVAIPQLNEVAALYAQYPEVTGAGTWYLGQWDSGPIANQTQKLILPVTNYTLATKFQPAPSPAPGIYFKGASSIQTFPKAAEAPPMTATVKRTRNAGGFFTNLAGANRLELRFGGFQMINDRLTFVRTPDAAVFVTIPPNVGAIQSIVRIEETFALQPPVSYARVIHVIPNAATVDQISQIQAAATAAKQTVTFSYDDAGDTLQADNTAVLWDLTEAQKAEFTTWYAGRYPNTKLQFRATVPKAPSPTPNPNPLAGLVLGQLFNVPYVQTSPFNAVRSYGLHEGVDFDVVGTDPNSKASVLCVYPGIVERSLDSTGGYGKYVRVQHSYKGTTFYTRYAHLDARYVEVGQSVIMGTALGEIGSTGNVTGEHVHLNLEVPGFGLPGYVVADVVDPTPYLPKPITAPTPPPVNTPALRGLHASADPGDIDKGPGGEAEFTEFKTLKPGVIKVLSAHSESSIARLASDHAAAKPKWIIRAFLSFTSPTGPRNISPDQFFADTFSDTNRAVQTLKNRGVAEADIFIELHNEPNLVLEGLGGAWTNGATFNTWLISVTAKYRTALPTIKLMYPGLSPGGTVAGVRTDAPAFLAACAPAIAQLDATGAHAYWINDADRGVARNWVAAHVPYGKPVWVTEASYKGPPTSGAVLAAQYDAFLAEVGVNKVAEGVTFYVASATDPAFFEEAWIRGSNKASRGIAAAMKK